MTTLARAEWTTRRDAHHERVDALLAEHRWRSTRGIKHPVEDFLFEYYTYRPYQLRRWHPGHGTTLLDADDWLEEKDYRATDSGVLLDTPTILRTRGRTATQVLALLRATSERKPSFGCFGMHEWAMVDGLRAEETRHPQLGLRVGPEQVSETIRSVGVRCTHVDAYRFFTPSAKPLNDCIPTRANQVELDQPGCLHVGMDLYKSAYKLSPMVGSELIADCFELARRIRVLDMRASPYDVSSFGLRPVAVDTVAGRAEYAAEQRELALAAEPLRARLLAQVTAIAVADPAASVDRA
ncbi:3-methyladenine DNA glycosylase [Granulicoccus sp. GXG6511]|uniref:3-methyladenine DNA glycosylase n=1 Tax=Granulicoccus sp. GXG6511 TaxID=3381351 RepID=UPI003D7C864E